MPSFGMTQLRSASEFLSRFSLLPSPEQESLGPDRDEKLLAQTQLGDERGVALSVFGFEVVEQFATTADHAQQATSTMVVFGVGFEVRGQFIDACSQDGDLHFGTASIVGGTCIGLYDLSFIESCHGVFQKI